MVFSVSYTDGYLKYDETQHDSELLQSQIVFSPPHSCTHSCTCSNKSKIKDSKATKSVQMQSWRRYQFSGLWLGWQSPSFRKDREHNKLFCGVLLFNVLRKGFHMLILNLGSFSGLLCTSGKLSGGAYKQYSLLIILWSRS